jgi:hypothetical protein
MDDAKFDRLARAFAKNVSRRLTFALIGGATGMFGQHVARGFPLGPATCGEQGAVCTLGSGCCDGLTCVTSAINTSYGVCVPGEGGMLSTGTTLISPFSETVVEDVRALMPTASTAPATDATDLQAEREARIAEIQARTETRRTERRTRLDTKRATVRTRNDEQRNRQREDREAKNREPNEVVHGPQLQLKLLFRKVDGDSGVNGEQLVPIEVVRATNRDDVKVVLTRIETIKGDPNGADLTTSQFTLGPGKSYSFVSGLPSGDATKNEYRWLDKVACDETIQGQGYRVKAAFSRGEENHDFVVRCDGPHATGAVETRAAPSRRKHTKNDAQNHKRNGQPQKKKKR